MTVYQVRKRFSDGRGAARVDKDGDLNVSFPKPPGQAGSTVSGFFKKPKEDDEDDNDELLDDHDHGPDVNEDRHEAWRFLLAGGVAGAGESVKLLHFNLSSTRPYNTLPHVHDIIRSARIRAHNSFPISHRPIRPVKDLPDHYDTYTLQRRSHRCE